MRLLKADENRCAKEKRERWTKSKEAVSKGDAAGFRIIKEKCQEKWAGEKDVSNEAQLRAQADKWAELWAAQPEVGHSQCRPGFKKHGSIGFADG